MTQAGDEERDLDDLPPVPEHLIQELTDERAERIAEEHLLLQARTPAPDRFESQFGMSWQPTERRFDAPSTEAVAEMAQDAATQAAQVLAIAEAHHVLGLVTAYERSIEDLQVRFGSSIGHRGGLGAQAFFRSMGLQLRMHPARIAHLVDAAVLVRDRMPRTWRLFLGGGSSWSRIDRAVATADGLDREHWPAYDEAAARLVVHSTRLKRDLHAAREKLQQDAVAARARTTHERRTTSVELGHDGEASLVITGPAAAIVAVNDALHRTAVAAHGVPGETRGIGALRHDVAVDCLQDLLRRGGDGDHDAETASVRVPERRPVDVSLVLTVPALGWLGRTTEQAILSGYGPISMEVAKDLAGQAKSFVRVLTDPVTGVRLTMDRATHAPPADLARWVRIRDGRSRFPGSTRPAHLCDIDHAREWRHGGRTDAGNLVALDRPAHDLKTAGLFQEELLDTGIVGWTDAWRHHFEDPPVEPLDPVPGSLLPRPRDDPDEPPPF